MGATKRRLYKPERAPARKKGVSHSQAPIACPDAEAKEIAMAIYSICESADVVVGRGGDYDWLKDEYTIVGKSKATGKAQDFTVPGAAVAALIMQLRAWNGVQRFDKQAMVKALTPGMV
jgi:hypothetical protein